MHPMPDRCPALTPIQLSESADAERPPLHPQLRFATAAPLGDARRRSRKAADGFFSLMVSGLMVQERFDRLRKPPDAPRGVYEGC